MTPSPSPSPLEQAALDIREVLDELNYREPRLVSALSAVRAALSAAGAPAQEPRSWQDSEEVRTARRHLVEIIEQEGGFTRKHHLMDGERQAIEAYGAAIWKEATNGR